MTQTIPLFPLSTVLFPVGRMSLQIFESRYLDLVSSCLKGGTGFGVVWLREGSEVQKEGTAFSPKLAQVGTYANIVDWDSLPNGLLGLTIEGKKKFRLISSFQRDDKLHMAEVEWIESEPVIDLSGESEDMHSILSQLLEHPHIERLKLAPDVNDISTLSFLLAQLLPINETVKFDLLSTDEPINRLEILAELLEEFNQ